MPELRKRIGLDFGASTLRLAETQDLESVREMPDFLLTERPRFLKPPSDPWEAVHLRVLETPPGLKVTQEFAFGRAAQDFKGTALDPRVSKLSNPQIRHALVAMLAAYAAETGATVFDLGIGIPMMDFMREAERDAFCLQFRGAYCVQFVHSTNPVWAALGQIRFRVDGLLAICEGEPAITLAGATGEEYRAGFDGGRSTADIPVFRRNRFGVYELQSHLCGAGPLAMGEAMDTLRATLGRANGGIKISDQDIAEAMTRHDGQLRVGNTWVDISREVMEVLMPVAEQAAGYLHQVWQGCPQLTGFELLGGGGVLLAPLLPVAYQTVAQAPMRFSLRLADNPRLVNVLGFAMQAQEEFVDD